MDRQSGEDLLKRALGNTGAKFREGQWEAIDALVNQKQKLMVVQRTGWGKSSVYFTSLIDNTYCESEINKLRIQGGEISGILIRALEGRSLDPPLLFRFSLLFT